VELRLLLWNVGDSQTTLAELREKLPDLEPPSVWIANEAAERFGAVVFGDEAADALGEVQGLIGRGADVAEEFETLDG
jgi:hypothetical protein